MLAQAFLRHLHPSELSTGCRTEDKRRWAGKVLRLPVPVPTPLVLVGTLAGIVPAHLIWDLKAGFVQKVRRIRRRKKKNPTMRRAQGLKQGEIARVRLKRVIMNRMRGSRKCWRSVRKGFKTHGKGRDIYSMCGSCVCST
jgi:hypothetical protein